MKISGIIVLLFTMGLSLFSADPEGTNQVKTYFYEYQSDDPVRGQVFQSGFIFLEQSDGWLQWKDCREYPFENSCKFKFTMDSTERVVYIELEHHKRKRPAFSFSKFDTVDVIDLFASNEQEITYNSRSVFAGTDSIEFNSEKIECYAFHLLKGRMFYKEGQEFFTKKDIVYLDKATFLPIQNIEYYFSLATGEMLDKQGLLTLLPDGI